MFTNKYLLNLPYLHAMKTQLDVIDYLVTKLIVVFITDCYNKSLHVK